MVQLKGMDFKVVLDNQDCCSLLNAWRQQLIAAQQQKGYELLDRYLGTVAKAISANKLDHINFDPPDAPVRPAPISGMLANAMEQVAFDIVTGAIAYDGFPENRRDQLVWLTWNIMLYEQLANHLSTEGVPLSPLSLNLPEREEMVCRYTRNRLHQQDYVELIGSDYEGHDQAAEILLENLNDSIDVLAQLVPEYYSVKDLAKLHIDKVRILIGLKRREDAEQELKKARALIPKSDDAEDITGLIDQA